MAGNWRQQVAPDWVPALEPMAEHLASIGTFLRTELSEGRSYLPASEHILAAFARPLAQVRVLIVGQDPYPTPGDPMGLSFSVPRGRPMPRSLLNIARELESDTGERLLSGDLSHWADQGVLLLNRCLTVRPGEPGSHRRQGWEEFTAHAIATVADRPQPLVAVLWGNDAQQVAPMLGKATVIASPHPSPLSASRGFFGSRPFSKANAALGAAGAEPIRWGTPPTGESAPLAR